METSLFGIVYVFFVVLLLLRQKNAFENLVLLCVVTETFVELGIVVKVGTTEMSPAKFVGHVLSFYCLFNYKTLPPRLLRIWLALLLCYLIPVLLLAIFPSNMYVASGDITWDAILIHGERPVYPTVSGEVIKMTLRLIVYSFTVVYILNTYTQQMYRRLLINVAKCCVFFLIIGCVEFLCKNLLGLNDMWEFGKTLLFGDTKYTFHGRLRGSLYELELFTKETSHFAYTMFLSAIIIMTNNILKYGKLTSRSFFLCLFLIIVSTSFSGLMFILALLCIMLVYRWSVEKPRTTKMEIVSLIALTIVSVSSLAVILSYTSNGFVGGRLFFLYDNFEAFVTTDWSYNNSLAYTDGSTMIRLVSVIQTLMAFSTRPIFGFSIHSIVCHGSTAMFLANVGVVGMYFWIKFYFYSYPKKVFQPPIPKPYLISIIIYLFVNLLNSYLLLPFHGLTPLLISVCFCYMFNKSNVKMISLHEK